MASIIKTTDRNRKTCGVAFNFDDMQTRADAYLAQIREQGARIVAEAQREAEQIRKRAELEGLKVAQRSHQAQIEAETGRRVQSVLPALRAVADELQRHKQAWLARWEQAGVQLATRIAERILRRELRERPDLPVTLVRESLQLAVGGDGLRILLNPDDAQSLGSHVESVVAEFARIGRAEIVPDPRIAPGGCRVETVHGVIDQQIPVQLKRIEEELT